jgi:hypothetical protein
MVLLNNFLNVKIMKFLDYGYYNLYLSVLFLQVKVLKHLQ